MSPQDQRERGDLGALMRMLRRRLPLIVLTTVIAVGAAFLIAKSQKKAYTATSVLLFKPLLLDVQLTGLPLQLQSSDPTIEAATDIGLVSLPQVRNAAAKSLGDGYTPDYLKNHVTVSQQTKSQLIGIQATAPTPAAAATIANAMARSFLAYERAALVSRINTGIAHVQHDLNAHGQTALQRAVLRNNLTKLTELKAVEPDNVQLAALALPPTSPSSPKTTLDLVIGGIAGLILGLALALIAEQVDPKVRRAEEVEDALDLPVLATIPRSRVLRKGVGLTTNLSDRDLEAFRLLRTNLRYRSGGRDIRSVLLTSAAQGSGKTTVALHLAAAAAAAMSGNVLLIEADMRRPHLAELLDIDPEHGLSTALRSGKELNEVVVPVPSAHWTGTNGSDPAHTANAPGGFDVLAAGSPAADASELLGSEPMSRLLASAAASYALTIIEGPPPGLVSDVIPLIHQVDAVLLVARLGRENSPELRNLRTQLEGLGVTPLGVVANFSRRTSNPPVPTRR